MPAAFDQTGDVERLGSDAFSRCHQADRRVSFGVPREKFPLFAADLQHGRPKWLAEIRGVGRHQPMFFADGHSYQRLVTSGPPEILEIAVGFSSQGTRGAHHFSQPDLGAGTSGADVSRDAFRRSEAAIEERQALDAAPFYLQKTILRNDTV